MKSYWIVAAACLFAAGPSRSNALVACVVQDDKPAVQAQPSPASSAMQQTADLKTPAAGKSDEPVAAAAAAPQSRSSYLLVELTKSLKAKKLKPGDKIKASVSQDVLAHGKIIIPVETELVGHVTEVSVYEAGKHESRLGIVFDKILLKHFRDVAFKAVVQAVAPPAPRPSRVDQPSQMLPPSMVAGGMKQQGSSAPMGRSSSPTANRGQAAPSPAAAMTPGSSITYQAPLTVKQSPANNASVGSIGASLETSPGGKPMSVGMPQGVTGLKGLSLSSGTVSTPGPVIVSSTDNVKLDSGTQILLRVLSVETPPKQ